MFVREIIDPTEQRQVRVYLVFGGDVHCARSRRLIQEGFRRQSRIARTRTTFCSRGSKSRRGSISSNCGDIRKLWRERHRKLPASRCLPKVNRENSYRDRDPDAHKIGNHRADRPAPPAGSRFSRSAPTNISFRFFPVDEPRFPGCDLPFTFP